jgi:hypothetical protein
MYVGCYVCMPVAMTQLLRCAHTPGETLSEEEVVGSEPVPATVAPQNLRSNWVQYINDSGPTKRTYFYHVETREGQLACPSEGVKDIVDDDAHFEAWWAHLNHP